MSVRFEFDDDRHPYSLLKGTRHVQNKLDPRRACRTEPWLSDGCSRDAHKQQIHKI
jgi:hypothetical protein